MANLHGTPIWYELMTDAPDRAEDFYGKVLGWAFEEQHGGLERDYRIFTMPGEEAVGGLMHRPERAPGPAGWDVYFGVDDVDATTENVKTLGGAVHMEPQDIPNVGRFAYVADPQGATFYLMRGFSEEASHSFEPETTGHCSWNELVTSDQVAALDFYGKLFGWEKLGAMEMGPMGDYTFFGTSEQRIGAMMNAPDPKAGPFWNFCFQVNDIDAAKEAVEKGGGTVDHGPIELPDDSGWLIQARDPDGAKVMFSGPKA